MVNVCNNTDAAGFAGKSGRGLDFGKHGAGFKIARFDVFGEVFDGDSMNSFCFRGAEVDVGIRYCGNGDEDVGFDFFGKAFGGKVFVDDGIDAFKAF